MDFIKKIYLSLIYRLGMHHAFHQFARHQITILYVHGIMTDQEDSLWTPLRPQLSPQQLSHSLAVLSQHYTFISLSDALEILTKQRPAINNALVLTLDDGYLNNIKYGAPIFKKFNIVPTIFVATEHTEHNLPFWFDRLDYALQQITSQQYVVQLKAHPFIFDCASRTRLKQSYANFRRSIKSSFTCDQAMRNYLDQLCQQIEQDTSTALMDISSQDDWSAIASWLQLADAIDDGSIEVGSHTCNHARLALLPANIISREIERAKQHINNKLAITCNTFCYPDNSYNSTAINVVRQHYDCALTADTGLNKIGGDLQTLKRFSLPVHSNPQQLLYTISALRHRLLTMRKQLL